MKNREKGQIVLVILLVMAVGLTVGIALGGRTATDVKLSSRVEESSRAFSAAEAGIEQTLKSGIFVAPQTSSGTISDTQSRYNVALTSVGNSGGRYDFPSVIADGDSQTIWLSKPQADGTFDSTTKYSASRITVCWSPAVNLPPTVPAVDISLFYIESTDGQYKVARTAYDPDSSRGNLRGFNIASTNGCSGTYSYYARLSFSDFSDPVIEPAVLQIDPDADTLVALRVRPVYADIRLAVDPQNPYSLPEQGKFIDSTGMTASGVTRKWNVEDHYAAPADIFDYVLWSSTDIIK